MPSAVEWLAFAAYILLAPAVLTAAWKIVTAVNGKFLLSDDDSPAYVIYVAIVTIGAMTASAGLYLSGGVALYPG